jgi:hypothetical protein
MTNFLELLLIVANTAIEKHANKEEQVRNSSKGAKVASQYSDVRIVYGDLDSTDLIAEEAKNADIVYRKLPNATT